MRKHPCEFRTACSAVQYCGLYRPNVTPGTKRGVGAHVCTARQSQDCLRVHPSRAPPLFVAVRSAAGSVQPTVARAFPAFGSLAAPTFGCTFALRCIIRSAIRAVRLRMEYHPSPSITVSTAPYASSRSCALRSPVALRLSPSRYWSRIPLPCCGASAPYGRALRGIAQYMSFRQSLRMKSSPFLCKAKP